MKNKKIFFIAIWLFPLSILSQREIVFSTNGIGVTENSAVQKAILHSLTSVYSVFYPNNGLFNTDSLEIFDLEAIDKANILDVVINSTNEIYKNSWLVNITFKLSFDELERYYESNGGKLQYEGSLFSQNIQILELIEKLEYESICNLFQVSNDLCLNMFDYKLSNSEPISIDEINEKWLINFKVSALYNNNAVIFNRLIINNLKNLSLTELGMENYKILEKPIYKISIIENSINQDFYLRSPLSLNVLSNFINSWEGYVRSFDIDCNSKIIRGNSIPRELSNRTNKNIISNTYKNIIKVKEPVLECDDKGILIELPVVSDTAGILDWFEFFNFNQMEKIEGFKLEPNRILVFKQGGFLITESNGSGIILSPFELTYKEFLEKRSTSFGAFDDWEVPSFQDYMLIKQHLYLFHFCNFSERKQYITSTVGNLSEITIAFDTYNAFGEFQNSLFPNQTQPAERVRLIRKF